jgi:quercetin 2,3-dioxygenase
VKSDSIPAYENAGARIRVVAGTVDGVTGPVTDIAVNPLYMDISLDPDTSWELPVPLGQTLRAYVFEGNGDFGLDISGKGTPIPAVNMVTFEDGEYLGVKTGKESGVRFMLMAGLPINEPIVPYGPFVMNTAEEIQQALVELRNGTFVKS